MEDEMTNGAAVAWYYEFGDTGEAGPVTFGGDPGREAIEWAERYGHTLRYLVPATTVAELRAEVERLQALSAAISRDCNECANQRNAAIADGRKLAEALDRVVGWCNGVMNHPNIAFNPELYKAAKKVKDLVGEPS